MIILSLKKKILSKEIILSQKNNSKLKKTGWKNNSKLKNNVKTSKSDASFKR